MTATMMVMTADGGVLAARALGLKRGQVAAAGRLREVIAQLGQELSLRATRALRSGFQLVGDLLRDRFELGWILLQ